MECVRGKNRTSFKINMSFWEVVRHLTLEERGKIFTYLCEYEIYNKEPNLEKEERVLQIAWSNAKSDSDKSFANWKLVCEKNARNINKRWGNNITTNSIEDLKEDTLNDNPFDDSISLDSTLKNLSEEKKLKDKKDIDNYIKKKGR